MGLPVEVINLNAAGVPQANKQGIVKKVRQWDERGNEIEIAYFGTDGEPVSDQDGIHKEKLVYDQKMREQRLKADMSRANKEI